MASETVLLTLRSGRRLAGVPTVFGDAVELCAADGRTATVVLDQVAVVEDVAS
jgi:hypothetical protein